MAVSSPRSSCEARFKNCVLPCSSSAIRFIPAFTLRNLELPLGLANSHFIRRIEDREVAADDLVDAVALDPLRALVPRDDRARRIEHEDRVVDDAGNQKLELFVGSLRPNRVHRPPSPHSILRDAPAGRPRDFPRGSLECMMRGANLLGPVTGV